MTEQARRRTALYDSHVALGARMVEFAGYDMPVQYDGILAEHGRVRTKVGLFDVSHMGEVRISGTGALAAVNKLITNDLGKVGNGRAQYTALCHEDGTIVDDLICYRLSPEEVFICVNASNRTTDVAHMQARLGGDARLADESDQYSQIAVQGPNAPALLGRIFGDVAKTAPFRIKATVFDGAPCYFATTGYTGEVGAELYLPNDRAAALWAALMEQGKDLGVGPVGLGARDTLRLEMAYCLYGNDIDRTTTPLEAGLGWVTNFSKGDFVGRSVLVDQAASGVAKKLVGIEVFERGIPRHGYVVKRPGEGSRAVGHVTSGTLSPTTGRAIGLAYVETALSAIGSELAVDCRGKDKPARVVPTPFYHKPV